MHNPRLRRSTFDYAEKMLAYLREMFAKTPRAFGLSAEDAALLATSIWSGLLTNSCYHKEFDRSRARELFRRNLLMLAGSERQSLDICETPTRSGAGGNGRTPVQRRLRRNRTTRLTRQLPINLREHAARVL